MTEVEQTDLPSPEPVEASKTTPPYRIFISYLAGKKNHQQVLYTPFEDIDTEERLAIVANYLEQNHSGKNVIILFWRALDG